MRFKKYKLIAAALVLSMSLGMMAGCGGNSGGNSTENSTENNNGNNNENTNGGTNGDNTESTTEEPAEKEIKDIYPATSVQDLYKITDVELEGYSIDVAYMRDDYVMLTAWDNSNGSIKLLLMNLKSPGDIASMDLEDSGDNFYLLSDGQLLQVRMQDSYKVYDSKLNLLYEFNEYCGAYIGTTKDNEFWFYTNEDQLVLHQNGKVLQTVSITGVENIYDYLGDVNGKAWFKMIDEEFTTACYSINMNDWTVEKEEGFLWEPTPKNGWVSYESEDKWYISDLENPLNLTAFTKTYSNESCWRVDEKYLVGYVSVLTDDDKYVDNMHVYDMSNGGECASLCATALSGYSLQPLDFNNDMVLMWAADNNMKFEGLYLWDISGKAAAQSADYYTKLDYSVNQERFDQLVSEFMENYGIEIYYSKEDLSDAIGFYDLTPCDDINVLGKALLFLDECAKEYPEGFYQDLKGDNFKHVKYYLCSGHELTVDYMIENPAATASAEGDSIIMTVDVRYLKDLRRTLLHETMHMMENRIEQEAFKNSLAYVLYWNEHINSTEYPLMYNYNWERDGENMKGVYGVGDEDTWYFVDDYSKCTYSEDRARTLENQIYSGSSYIFEGEHLKKKARFLNAQIRDAFPCVQNSTEEVLWEHMTGIVDLKTEFPDYFETK